MTTFAKELHGVRYRTQNLKALADNSLTEKEEIYNYIKTLSWI